MGRNTRQSEVDRHLWEIPAIMLSLALTGLTAVQAQSFTTLKNYGVASQFTGTFPSSLVQGPDGTLYGTVSDGEGDFRGALFKIQPDGSGFVLLKIFREPQQVQAGHLPGGLVRDGSTLYGTISGYGTSLPDFGSWAVFRVNTDGTGFAVLHSFDVSSTGWSSGSLALSGSALYGMTEGFTQADGTEVSGTLYKVNADGTGYAVLKTFNGSDGRLPRGTLLLSDNTLYGTTFEGGSSGYGTLFKLNTDGSGFATIMEFDYDGRNPWGRLVLSGNMLYGTTAAYGDWDTEPGAVFRVNTDGLGYTLLARVVAPNSLLLNGTTLYGTSEGLVFRVNTDGTGWQSFSSTEIAGASTLLLSGGILYGTAQTGGSSQRGSVFKMNTDGTGRAVLKNFILTDAQVPAGVTLSGSTLYGITLYGGVADQGTVFKLNTDGSGYTVLKRLNEGDVSSYSSSVYANPPVVEGTALYGTTMQGGSRSYGTVFRLNTDGTGFTMLTDFTGGLDGGWPQGRLVSSGGALFGTTERGGNFDYGTVFTLNTDGTEYGVLKHFSGGDGDYPRAGLLLSGSTLYGTARTVVFRLNTDGTGYTVLKQFATNEETYCMTPLALAGNTLYGTADASGAGVPILFRVNTDGTGYRVLKSFTPQPPSLGLSGLLANGNTLYGTTSFGGTSQWGTIFQINTDGTDYAVLREFASIDGADPVRGLELGDNILYGTTARGGEVGSGTIFRLELPGTPETRPAIISHSLIDGVFQLTVTGAVGTDYAIQVSASPTSGWTTILRTNSPPIPFSFTDPDSAAALARFYRVLGGASLP